MLEQQQACALLELDAPSYSRFERGIRKPTAEAAFKIEKLSEGAVPARSWYQPPLMVRSKARRAS